MKVMLKVFFAPRAGTGPSVNKSNWFEGDGFNMLQHKKSTPALDTPRDREKSSNYTPEQCMLLYHKAHNPCQNKKLAFKYQGYYPRLRLMSLWYNSLTALRTLPLLCSSHGECRPSHTPGMTLNWSWHVVTQLCMIACCDSLLVLLACRDACSRRSSIVSLHFTQKLKITVSLLSCIDTYVAADSLEWTVSW